MIGLSSFKRCHSNTSLTHKPPLRVIFYIVTLTYSLLKEVVTMTSGGEITFKICRSTGVKTKYLFINWYSISQKHTGKKEGKKESQQCTLLTVGILKTDDYLHLHLFRTEHISFRLLYNSLQQYINIWGIINTQQTYSHVKVDGDWDEKKQGTLVCIQSSFIIMKTGGSSYGLCVATLHMSMLPTICH